MTNKLNFEIYENIYSKSRFFLNHFQAEPNERYYKIFKTTINTMKEKTLLFDISKNKNCIYERVFYKELKND